MTEKRFIFNASFYTSPEIRPKWESWLYEKFLPLISGINPEVETEVFEVLSDVNQDMLVFAVQIRCATQEELQHIDEQSAPIFNAFREEFGENGTHFNSVLNKID